MPTSTMPRLFAAVVLLCVTTTVGAGTWDPARVHFIDASSLTSGARNWLFRGNEPTLPANASGIKSGTTSAAEGDSRVFVYDALVERLRVVAVAEGKAALPAEFRLVDVNLLHTLKEKPDRDAEQGFFKAHPNNGSFVHWPVYGGRAPEDFPHALRQKMAQELPHWQRDKLVERVAQLKAWLETPQDVPTVYFFHCEQGHDRTGELAGAYYIGIQNMTEAQALAYSQQIMHSGPPGSWEWAQTRWYCLYLQALGGRPHDDCGVSASLAE